MKHFNITMFIVATALTQYHGIQFWCGFVNSWAGVVWSISLEAAALWLWIQQGRFTPLALVASIMLLIGPLFHIVTPVIDRADNQALAEITRQAKVESITEEIGTLQTTLATSLKNSESRLGWFEQINNDKQTLAIKQAEKRALLEQQIPKQSYRPLILATVQAVTLFVVWVVSVMALKQLFSSNRYLNPVIPGNPLPAPLPSKLPVAQTTFDPFDLEGITNAIADRMKVLNNQGIKQVDWAKENGISVKTLSIIKNHNRRKAEGKSVAGRDSIMQVAELMGLVEPCQESPVCDRNLFQCPNCRCLHFNVTNNGLIICNSYHHNNKQGVFGCGWEGRVNQ